MRRAVVAAITVGLLAFVPVSGDANHDGGAVAIIPTGDAPNFLALDVERHRLYVTNQLSGDLSVIDTATRRTVATVATSQGPSHVTVDPMTGRIFFTRPYEHDVSVLDSGSLDVIAALDVGGYPEGLAIEPSTRRLYVGNSYAISVVDLETLTLVGTIEVPGVSIALDPTTGWLWAGDWYEQQVHVVDPETGTRIAATRVPYPGGIAVNASTGRVFVTEFYSDRLAILDARTGSFLGETAVGSRPGAVAVDVQRNRIYVANSDANTNADDPDTLSVVDGAYGMALTTFRLFGFSNSYWAPSDVVVDPASRTVYAAAQGIDAVAIFADDVPAPPSSPRAFRAQSGPRAGEITLSWDAPATSGEGRNGISYKIYRRAGEGVEHYYGWTFNRTFTDTGLDDAAYHYRVSAVNNVEGPVSSEVSESPPHIYSNDCGRGANVVRGSASGVFLKLQTLTSGDETWICARFSGGAGQIDDRLQSAGGRLVLSGSKPIAQPTVDQEWRACETEAGNLSTIPPIVGQVGDPGDPATYVSFALAVFVGRETSWACVHISHADSVVGRRIVVPVGPPFIRFLPDPPVTTREALAPVGGTASAKCDDLGWELLDLELGGDRLSLRATFWEALVELCVRVQGRVEAGGRLSVDYRGSPGITPILVTGTDDGPCSRNVVTTISPEISVRRSDEGTAPSICVRIGGGGWMRFTAGVTGDPAPPGVTWTPDD